MATLVACLPGISQSQAVPTGFTIQPVVGEPFGGAVVAFTFLPDGRVVILEKDTGNVRLAPAPAGPGPVASVIVHTIPDVTVADERGLLGVAVDPSWPQRPYLYFYLTHTGNVIHIVMYTASGDLTTPTSTNLTLSSPFVLLNDIPDLFENHNGGTLRFGPDGYLYASLGDDSRGCDTQDVSILRGKILRLDVSNMPGSGSGPPPKAALAPASNPFFGSDNARLVWAYGFRNPFRFTIDSPSDDLFIGDVGQETWEEMNRIPGSGSAGVNYGWPEFEGPLQDPLPIFADCSAPPFVDPIYVYPNPPGGPVAAVVAGPQYRPNPHTSFSFPRAYRGDVFVCEFYGKWLRRLEAGSSGWTLAPAVPGQPNSTDWATNLGNIADLQLGGDGALYLLVMFSAGNLPRGLHRIVNTLPSDADADWHGLQIGEARFVPNPASAGRGGRIACRLAVAGEVEARIYDPAGRLVRTLRGVAGDSGTRGGLASLDWDGRTERGTTLAPGTYFYEFITPTSASVRGKISLVR